MDAKPRLRHAAIPHRVYLRALRARRRDQPPRLRTLAAQSLWMGLASGWLELGAGAGHQALVGTVTGVTVWFSKYAVPLGLAAHLAIASVWLVVSAILSARPLRLRQPDLVTARLGWFVAFLSPLLALEELHWASSVCMAGGASMALAPWWIRRRGPILRRSLVPLGAATVLMAAVGFARVHNAEARALTALPAARPGAPNVVLVVLDTVRADHMSLYGYGRDTTPHLAALAKRAVRFDFARAPAPWTLPSHASMFTGRWPHELSADYDRPLDATFPTLAEFLGEHGYATGGFVGNTFYCNGAFGVARGFAHYEDEYQSREISAQQALCCSALARALMPLAVKAGLWPTTGQYSARKTAREVNRDALAWLDRSGGDRPFLLFLNYIDAHGPYTLPADFPHKFSQLSAGQVMEVQRLVQNKGSDWGVPESERLATLKELSRTRLDAYDDCIRYVDEQVGSLVADLERRGLDRNTWIIVTADHGEHFGEHGKYGHGNTMYRPLIDVPLLVVPPSGFEARGVAAPVSLRDLPATIADFVGLAESSPFPGRSLRRHWDATATDSGPDEVPLSELKLKPYQIRAKGGSPKGKFRSAIVDRDKIYHHDPLGAEELYDTSDRAEAHDLAPRPDAAAAIERSRKLMDSLRPREP